jgi:predicted enzyme related to lactoylglutathione lyase
MRRHLVLLAAATTAALAAFVPLAHAATTTTSTTAPPSTLPIATAPPTEPSAAPNPAATGTILMVKLPVGNVAAAEKFYGAVFGAKVAIKVGSAHIVTFPEGGPGLVLLPRNPKERSRTGAFIIKVPDLDVSEALALDHGAKKQATFAGKPSGQAARSVDLVDPWGNQVEILQIG